MDERRGGIPRGVDTSRIGLEVPKEDLQPLNLAQRLGEIGRGIAILICAGVMVEGGRQGNPSLLLAGFGGIYAIEGAISLIKSVIREYELFQNYQTFKENWP